MANTRYLNNPLRLEALTLEAKRWFGPPCDIGHDGWRYTSCGSCCECARLRDRKRRAGATIKRPTASAKAALKATIVRPNVQPADSIITPVSPERLMARR